MKHIESIIYYLLLALIYLTVSYYGGGEILDIAVVAALTGLLGFVHALAYASSPQRQLAYNYFRPALYLYGAGMLIGLAQCLPGLGFGASAALYGKAAEVLGTPVTNYISVSPQSTFIALMKLLTNALIFWLGLNAGMDRKRTHQLLRVMLMAGGVYAAAAIYQHMQLFDQAAQEGKPYQTPQHIVSLIRNHFADFIGIHLLIGATLVWRVIEKLRAKKASDTKAQQWNAYLSKMLPLLGITLLCACSLMLTASRAGVISFSLVFVGFVIFAVRRLSRRFAVIPLIVGGGAFTAFFIMLAQPLIVRFGWLNLEIQRRSIVLHDTLQASMDYLVMGSGLNTYADIFTTYRSDKIMAIFPNIDVNIPHAYNSYAELLLTAGIPGFLLFMLALLRIGSAYGKALALRSQSKAIPALGVAITIGLALHAMVDFSLHIPALSMLTAWLWGLTAASAFPKESRP